MEKRKRNPPGGRLRNTSKAETVGECEKAKSQLGAEIEKLLVEVNDRSNDADELLVINESLNMAMREYAAWDHRIVELGGSAGVSKYKSLGKRVGNKWYYGLAKDLAANSTGHGSANELLESSNAEGGRYHVAKKYSMNYYGLYNQEKGCSIPTNAFGDLASEDDIQKKVLDLKRNKLLADLD